MSLLSLDLLQQEVHPRIVRFRSTLIKTSASSARIHRLALDYAPGHSGVSSLVVKSIDPVWPGDPYGSDRELRFYRELHPQLDLTLAHPYHLGIEPSTGQRLIVMEDAETGFRFLSSRHQWTPEEIRCILRTYARFHAQGHHTLPEENQRND